MADIVGFINEARQRGISDEEINSYLTQKGYSLPTGSLPVPERRQSILGSLISGLTKPAIDYAKLLGEAGYQVGRFITQPTFRKAVLGGELTPEEARQLTRQRPTLFLSEKEIGTPEKILETGTRATAGALSYLVPGGGESRFARTGFGALAGGLYGFSQRQPVRTTALLGGAGGLVIPGLLGGVSKGLEKLGGFGKELRKGIIAPKVAVSPKTPEQEMALVERLGSISKKYGIGFTGSAKAIRDKVNVAYNKISERLGQVLSKSQKGIGVKRLTNLIRKELEENGEYFIPGDKTYERLLDRELKLIAKQSKTGKIPVSTLFRIKNELGKKLNRVFRIERGELQGVVPITGQVRRDIWSVLDNIITKIEPKAKDITRDLSVLHQVSPGLAKQVGRTLRVPFAGTRVTARPYQAVTERLGALLEKAGGLSALPEGLQNYLSQKLTSINQRLTTFGLPTVGEFTGRQFFLPYQPPGERGRQLPMPEQLPVPTSFLSPQEELQLVEEEPILTREEAVMLMAMYPKQASLIKSIYDLSQPKLSAQERDAINSAIGGLNILNTLQQSYNQLIRVGLTARSPGLGRLGGLSGTLASIAQSSPEAAAYNDTKQAFLSILSRATGERGVLTDYDIKRIEKAIPDFYDTPQTAERKWQMIRDIITAKVRNKMKSIQ